MKIFNQIYQAIKNNPEEEFKGEYNREGMDEEDVKEIGNWEEQEGWEGAYIKEVNGKWYRIIIESINTR